MSYTIKVCSTIIFLYSSVNIGLSGGEAAERKKVGQGNLLLSSAPFISIMAESFIQGPISGSFMFGSMDKQFYAKGFSLSKGYTNDMTTTIASWGFSASAVAIIWIGAYGYPNDSSEEYRTYFRKQGAIDLTTPSMTIPMNANSRNCTFAINSTNIGLTGTNSTAGSRYANWQFDGSVIAIGNK